MLHRAVFVVVVAATVGCDSIVPASNPFDPKTPVGQQEPASLAGTIKALADDGALVDVDGVEVVLTGPAAPDGEVLDVREGGAFARGDTLPGDYTLSARKPGYVADFRTVTLTPGARSEVDLVVVPLPGAVAGKTQVSGIAQRGAQLGLPAALQDHGGILVEVVGVGQRTVTNRAGRFDVFVDEGSVLLAVSADDHVDAEVAVEVGSEAVFLADTVLAVDFGRVRGVVVVEDGSAAGVVVSAASALANATAVADADGEFVFTDVIPGTYTLRADRQGSVAASTVVDVDGGADVALVDPLFLARARGSIEGTVVLVGADDDGGAVVSLTGTGFTATSSADGLFVVDDVPTGTYEVVVVKDGFGRAVVGSVVVDADAATDVGVLQLARRTGDFAINDGAAFTADADVVLSLSGSVDAVQMLISEDASFSGVAPLPFDEEPTFTLQDGDGAHVVFVVLIDADGVRSAPFSSSIVLDTTPPVPGASLLDGGALFSNNDDGLVTLAAAASDSTAGVARMQIVLDGTADTEPFEAFVAQKVIALADVEGAHVVDVFFEDFAGNRTTSPARLTITLDRTAPSIDRFVIDDDAAFARSPFVALTIDTDDASRMALATSSGTTPVFEPFVSLRTFLLSPGDGTKRVFVRLADEAGNVTDEAVDTIELDTRAPTSAAVTIAAGAAFSTSTTVGVAFAAIGATQMRVAADGVVDDEPLEDFVLTKNVVLGGAGERRVAVVYVDDAGNEAAAVFDSIVVDNAAPVLNAVAINAGAAFANNGVVVVTIDGSGADLMQVAVDGTADTEAFVPFATTTTAVLPPGDCAAAALDCKRVAVVLKDAAGNTSSARTDGITLDTQAPPIPLVITPSFTTATATATVDIAAPNNDAFFLQYEVVGGPTTLPAFTRIDPVPGNSTRFNVPLDVSSSTDPSRNEFENNIRLRAVDRAGNVSDESAVVIVTDTVIPDAPGLLTPSQTLNADVAAVNVNTAASQRTDATFVSFDVRNTVAGVQVFNARIAQGQFAVPLVAGDGVGCGGVVPCANVVDVRACDATGRCSAPTSVTLREDSTAPSQPLLSPDEGTINSNTITLDLLSPSSDNGAAVFRYQQRGGAFVNFTTVVDSDHFVFTGLANDRDHDLCVRGVDAAGNVGIESCALIHEVSSRVLLSTLVDEDPRDLVGDLLVLNSGGATKVIDVRTLQTIFNFPSGGASARLSGGVLTFNNGTDVLGFRFEPVTRQFNVFTDSQGTGSIDVDTNGTLIVGLPLFATESANLVFSLAPPPGNTLDRNANVLVPAPAGFVWLPKPRVACDHVVAVARKLSDSTREIFDLKLGAVQVSQPTITRITNDAINQDFISVSCDETVFSEQGTTAIKFRRHDTGVVTSVNGLQPVGEMDGHRYVFLEGGPNGKSRLRLHDRTGTPVTTDLSGFVAEPFDGIAVDGPNIVFPTNSVGNDDVSLLDLSTTKWLTSGPGDENAPRVSGASVVFHNTGAALASIRHVDLLTNVVTPIFESATEAASPRAFTVWDDGTSWFVPFTNGSTLQHSVRDEAGSVVAVDVLNGFQFADAHSGRHAWLRQAGAQRQLFVRSLTGPAAGVQRLSATNVADLVIVGDGSATGRLDAYFRIGDDVRCCRDIGNANCAGTGTSVGVFAGANRLRAVQKVNANGRGAVVVSTNAGRVLGNFVDANSCAAAGPIPIPNDTGLEASGAVSSDFVVWDDTATGDFEIKALDLNTGAVLNLSQNPASQRFPEVDGRRIVWQDQRFGTADIFLHER